jgi:hypothetical protein
MELSFKTEVNSHHPTWESPAGQGVGKYLAQCLHYRREGENDSPNITKLSKERPCSGHWVWFFLNHCSPMMEHSESDMTDWLGFDYLNQ